MKKLLFLLSLGLSLTFAQTIDINWGDESKMNLKSMNTAIFADEPNYFYSTRTTAAEYFNGDIYVDKVDKKSLNTESSFKVYSPTMYSSDGKTPRKMKYNEVIKVKDGFLVFFTEEDFIKLTFTSYCQKFDMSGNKVGDIKQLQLFQAHEKTVLGRFIVFRSPLNDGFFLMYSRPFIQYDNEYLVFDFFDYNIEKKWEKKQKFPFNGKEFEPRQYKSNPQDSTLYMMVRVLEETEEERTKKGNKNVFYSFSILSFKFDPLDTTSVFKATHLTVPKKYIADISFEVVNHEIIHAGFYADKKDMELSGAYCQVVEEYSGLVRSTSTMEFDRKVFNDKFVDLDKIASQRGTGIRDFELKDLQIMNDGSIFVLAENRFAAGGLKKVGKFFETVYMPFYNNIVVFNVGNDRKVKWITPIVKRQKETKFTMDEFSGITPSFTYAIYNNKVVCIYNDSPSNLTVTNPALHKYVGSLKGVVTIMATINSDGQVAREVLFDGENAKVVVRPTTSLVENKNTVYIYGFNGSKVKWGSIKFY